MLQTMQLSIVVILFDTLNLYGDAAVLTKKGVFNLLHAFRKKKKSTWDCQALTPLTIWKCLLTCIEIGANVRLCESGKAFLNT